MVPGDRGQELKMPLMQRRAGCRATLLRAATAACLVVLLSGCGVGRGFSGSGNGFGGFGGSRVAIPEAEANGYTMRRLKGNDDELGGLQPDLSVRWPDAADENRPSVFETEDERRAREARAQQSRRDTSTGSPDLPRTQPQDLVRPAPGPMPSGQAIPGAPPGTVGTGGSGTIGTFGGPAGSGTVLRDGGTTTLMGADGKIITVPTPR